MTSWLGVKEILRPSSSRTIILNRNQTRSGAFDLTLHHLYHLHLLLGHLRLLLHGLCLIRVCPELHNLPSMVPYRTRCDVSCNVGRGVIHSFSSAVKEERKSTTSSDVFSFLLVGERKKQPRECCTSSMYIGLSIIE